MPNAENDARLQAWDAGLETGRELVERDALETLTALRIGMGGIGAHVDPCRIPDTTCLCGVAGARDDARRLVEQAIAEIRTRVIPPGKGER